MKPSQPLMLAPPPPTHQSLQSIVIILIVLNCILIIQRPVQVFAKQCVIPVDSRVGEFQEKCNFSFEEADNQIFIDCSTNTTTNRTQATDLERCKEVVDKHFIGKRNGSPVCKMKLIMKYLAPHGILFDLNKISGKCQNNCFETVLTINNFIHVPSRIIPLYIFPHVVQNTMELKQLTISGGSIMPIGQLERGGVDTATIKQILKWSEAGEIIMEKITSDEAIVEGQYLIENKVKRKTESFLLDGSSYAGIRRYAIELMNVNRVVLKNVDFGNKPIEARAISLRWNEEECPEKEVKCHLMNLSGLGSVNYGPIVFENRCRQVNYSKLKLKFVVMDNNFWPNIPKNLFEQLLLDIDYFRNNTKLSFVFEQIDCCLEDNKWLFELKDKQNETKFEYALACQDIGQFVSNYSLWSLKDTCENRNVLPIYMIAIVAVILLALLLITFSCVCFFYVLPSRKQGSAIHVASDLGLQGGGGSSGSKSVSTEAASGKRSAGGGGAVESPTGVVTIHSNQSRVPRASMPGDAIQTSVSPEPKSANTFMKSPMAVLRSLFTTSNVSKPAHSPRYKQVKYSSVIPKKVFVESKAPRQASKSAPKGTTTPPPITGGGASKTVPKVSPGAVAGSKSKGIKVVAKNKSGLKVVKSNNASIRTMQTALSPPPPAPADATQPAKALAGFKTLGLSKNGSKGALVKGSSKMSVTDGKSERMSSVFQTIS